MIVAGRVGWPETRIELIDALVAVTRPIEQDEANELGLNVGLQIL